MKFVKQLLSNSDVEKFADRLSCFLLIDHGIKIKPIKLLHCIAKALGFKNWNHYTKNDTPYPYTFSHKSAELGDCIAKGSNSYILGGSGTGKSIYMFGLVVNNVNQTHRSRLKKYNNIVVVDAGHLYEELSQTLSSSDFINVTALNQSTLAPITLSEKRLTVFELEEIKHLKDKSIAIQLIEALKKATTKDSLVIIDQWWLMSSELKQWALAEFEGDTIVSAVGEIDLVHDKAYHLFNHRIELKGFYSKR